MSALQLPVGQIALRPLRRRDASRWKEVRLRAQDQIEPWEVLTPEASRLTWAERQSKGAWASIVRQDRRGRRSGRSWAAVVTLDGRFAGMVEVAHITGWEKGSRGELGYWIDPRLHGQGVGSAGVAMACDHAFASLGVHRLEAFVQSGNIASIRLLASMGFQREGVCRGVLWVADGWRDHELHAMLRTDLPSGVLPTWRARHAHGGSTPTA